MGIPFPFEQYEEGTSEMIQRFLGYMENNKVY
jgi:hypothetical protein